MPLVNPSAVMLMAFFDFFRATTGRAPYDYERRVYHILNSPSPIAAP